MAKGFLYVARNNAMPGLLKIGRTNRVPDARMSELFSTGVPEPFQIIYYAMTSDAKADEAQVHKVLSRFRHTQNREFFAINSTSAIGAITHLCEIEHHWTNTELDAAAKEGGAGFQTRQPIQVSSRHDIEWEQAELDEFIHEINLACLEAFVVSVLYDSKSGLCHIQLADGLDQDSEPAAYIHTIARDTLTRYEWFGVVNHGRQESEL